MTRSANGGPDPWGMWMLKLVKKLYALLGPRERRRFYGVVLLAVVNGLFEMVGVASILPFLAVLANPGRIESNPALNAVYEGLGFATADGFLTFLGLAVLGLVILSLGLRLASTYVIARFANMRAYSLSAG